jgi:hypothetical protein
LFTQKKYALKRVAQAEKMARKKDGTANELAPGAVARAIYSLETQQIESSKYPSGRVAEWLKAPDSKSPRSSWTSLELFGQQWSILPD